MRSAASSSALLRLALSTRLRHRLAPAASERALQLPARVLARGPEQEDQHADDAQEEAGSEPHLRPVALPLRQVGGDHPGREPCVEQVQGLGADGCDHEGHAPRYALWTSGLSRSASDLSVSATSPVSST